MKRGAFQRDTPQLGLLGVAEETNVGVGDEADFYPTPAWSPHAIIRRLGLRFARVLDPCAGDGALLQAACDMFGDYEHLRLSGIEIDPERAARARAKVLGGGTLEVRDALSAERWPDWDLALINPPFKLAEAFVRRALLERHDRGVVAVLLRLAFLESAERVELHREHPANVYVHANRPVFIDPQAWRPCPKCKGGGYILAEGAADPGATIRCSGCRGRGEVKGGSDSTAYAWFVYPGEGRWSVLDDRDPAKKPARRRAR